MVLSYLVSYLELNRSWWQILSCYGKIYMEVEIRKYYVVWFSLAQLFVLILLLLCPELCNRFKEGAELLSVCWLEIHGKILSKMLSRNTNYAAYLVYRIADRSYGLDFPFQEASVSIGGSTTTRQVGSVERRLKRRCSHALVLAEDIEHPQKRSDGWMELKLGELYNEEGDDGEVCISFRETEGHWKRGLVVQGIEIRPKKTLTSNCLACSHEKPSYSLLTTSRSSKEEIFLTDGLTVRPLASLIFTF